MQIGLGFWFILFAVCWFLLILSNMVLSRLIDHGNGTLDRILLDRKLLETQQASFYFILFIFFLSSQLCERAILGFPTGDNCYKKKFPSMSRLWIDLAENYKYSRQGLYQLGYFYKLVFYLRLLICLHTHIHSYMQFSLCRGEQRLRLNYFSKCIHGSHWILELQCG